MPARRKTLLKALKRLDISSCLIILLAFFLIFISFYFSFSKNELFLENTNSKINSPEISTENPFTDTAEITKILSQSFEKNEEKIKKDVIKDKEKTDFTKMFKHFKKLAKDNNVDAMYNLARCYHNGHGSDINYKKAAHWFKKAADFGHIQSMYQIANQYLVGKGVQEDLKAAFHWFKNAAERYNEDSMRIIGLNSDDSLHWIKYAAEQNNTEAMHLLGLSYLFGESVSQDTPKGLYWSQLSAERGHSAAMYILGVCFDACSIAANPYQIENLLIPDYSKDSTQTVIRIMSHCYECGLNGFEAKNKSFYWFTESGKLGNAAALKRLETFIS